MNNIISFYFLVFDFLAKKNIQQKKITSWQAHCHITVMVSTGILMWAYSILAYQTINHSTPWVIGVIASLIHNCSPLFLKYPGSIRLATNFLIGAGMIHQGCFAYFSGGFMSPILIWFGILPMIAGIIDGSRGVKTWSILTLLTAGILLGTSYFGLKAPNYISHNGRVIGQSMMVFGWIFLSSLIIITFIFFKNQNENIISNAYKRIESLIQVLCHDFSNPLMNIAFRIRSLEKEKTFKDNTNLHRIKRSVADLESMVNHIRIWQSSKTGKMKLEITPLFFAKLIPDLLAQFEDKLLNKNIEVVYNDTALENTQILADKKVLYSHIISNILSNAIKFSPRNSKIEINFKEKSGLGIIEIQDYGIGIPKSLMAKVFNVNEVTSRIGTEGEAGTGFGLPIVKTLVEAMNGNISIKSCNKSDKSNKTWTKFTVSFPTHIASSESA